jgi:alpha-2-macroglobulin
MTTLSNSLRLTMVIIVAIVSLLIPTGCNHNSPVAFNPEFAKYIAGYTSGQVSIASTIKIQLTEALAAQIQSMQIPLEKLVQTSPAISGQTHWNGNNTIEFVPNEWLDRGQKYTVDLHLNELVEVKKELETFSFEFRTKPQFIDVHIDQIVPVQTQTPQTLRLAGTLRTNDVCAITSLPSVIDASFGGQDIAIRWENTNEANTYRFIADSIHCQENSENIVLRWNTQAIGGNDEMKIEQRIPGKSEFNVFMVQAIQLPNQYAQLLFSSPLNPSQDLKGLIDISECQNEKFIIENNEVRVYPSSPLTGQKTIFIHPGIKGLNGEVSKEEQSFVVTFEDLKPNLKIGASNRVILPSTDGLVFPFEAVALQSVEVVVSKIYESNIPQFLQVNSLDGNDEMYRVSKKIKQTRVQLNTGDGKDLSKWNTFYIDLNNLIHAEPGAIYNIQLDFNMDNTLFPCNDVASNNSMRVVQASNDEEGEDESEYDDEYGYYEDYDSDDWDYKQKDNPCSKAYYNYRYPVSKNILASDIGIIAKQSENNAFLFAVTDMITTKPLSGVTVDVLDFQQQVIGSVKTDEQGMAQLAPLNDKPFLIIAKLDKQRGYLKIGNGESLSMSTFDTGGARTQSGMKGFIYGERGVWRPGDTLFLNFILSQTNNLPESHPVEFQLLNPQGRMVYKTIKSESVGNMYNFTCQTQPDAVTGMYTANVIVGGSTFSKSLRIENVKPNRLKLNFDNPEVIVADASNKSSTRLHAQWLHGAPAKNLKTNVTINYTTTATTFTNWKNYHFDDPVRKIYSEEKVLFEGSLNMEGEASIPNNIEIYNAPGMLNVNYMVKVFEEGGDFSVDRFTCKYAPYKTFVGVKTATPANGYAFASGEPTMVEVATVSPTGNPIATSNLKWKLFKVEWRYWWEQNGNTLANYIGSESAVPVSQGVISTNAQGKASFQVSVDKTAWGRYLLRVEDENGKHATGKSMYFDWPDESSRANRKNNEGATYLSFTCDKPKYNAGENCVLTIPGAKNATALVSIEGANGVIRKEWISAGNAENKYTFVTDKSMAPNVYVHISLIQPHGQTVNDMPIRLYGVIPVFVEFPESRITPVITMPDELAPEQTFGIQVKEQSGRGMSYTLAVVDEGLLDLTRHKTADPWGFFYQREALGVRTFDMYDQVIGAMGKKIEKLLTLGGDGAVVDKNKQTANRFKPVVMFLGPFNLEPGQTMNHKLTMPNYVGSVRVMVVAENAPAYGNAEKTVPVKKPLMVLSTLPRTLGITEEIALPVTVFAMDKNISSVKVKVETNEFMSVNGEKQETITFSKPGDKIINFQLTVADRQGIGKVRVTAESPTGHTAYHDIEIDVRNPNPYETRSTENVVAGNSSWNGEYNLHGTPGTNSVKIEVSSLPALNVENQMHYLIRYPHGCVEQTTSSAFPQLYISDLIDLSDYQKNATNNNINAAIQKLSSFVVYDGGLSYWPGYRQSEQWGSTYAGHFLLEAKKKGYHVSDDIINGWMNFQERNAQAWTPQTSIWQNLDHLQQAYRLYTLALAGRPEWGAMSRLKALPDLSGPAKWRLAGAYALAGRPDEAKAIIANTPTTVGSYRELGYTYGSNWRDAAMVIETLVILNERTRALPLLIELSKGLNSERFYSTQTTAFTLLAYGKFVALQKPEALNFQLTGGTNFTKKINTASTVSIVEIPIDGDASKVISIQNKGKSDIYVRVVSTGQPNLQSETLQHTNIYTEIEYEDMSGNKLNVNALEQGTEFYAKVRIWNSGERGDLRGIALEQVFAGGWEIGNQRLDGVVLPQNISMPDYQDIKDDRVFSYFDLYRNETKIFRIRLTAAYAGRFYLPGLKCSPMYDESVQSRQVGQWVNVIKPAVAGKP